MTVEERLRAAAPPPPPGLKAAILREAERRARSRVRDLLPGAAALLLCVGLLAAILPGRRDDASPAGPQDDARIERLVRDLGDADPGTREAAARDLREIGPPARERLQKALEDPDLDLRNRAAELLADVALLPIHRALREPMQAFCAKPLHPAAEALHRMLPTPRPALLQSLKTVVAGGTPRAKRRAEDLLRLLSREGAVRYGMIFLEVEVASHERTPALEVWVNDGPGAVWCWNEGGFDIDHFAPGDEEGTVVCRGAWGGEKDGNQWGTLTMAPGGHSILSWTTTLTIGTDAGRYEIVHHSSYLEVDGERIGRPLQSPRLSIRIR